MHHQQIGLIVIPQVKSRLTAQMVGISRAHDGHQDLRHFGEESGSSVPCRSFKILMRIGDGGVPNFRNVVIDGGASAYRPTEGGGTTAAGACHVPQGRRFEYGREPAPWPCFFRGVE